LFIISAIFTVILISIFNKFFPKFREQKPLVKKPDSKFIKRLLFITLSYVIYFFAFLVSNIVYNIFELSLFLGGLFILTGVILIIEVIKSPKKKHKNKSLDYKKPVVNRRGLITSIRIIYIIIFFIFILVYGFFLGGLFILIGFILILEIIISSLNKNKKNFHQTKSKIKIFTIKKVNIVRYIVNSFLKHVLILFSVLFLNFILIRSFSPSEINAYLPATGDPDDYWRIYELGLHLPLWQQFFLYLGRLFTGNWGYTIRYRWPSGFYSLGSPVKELILERISNYFIILIIPISLLLFFNIRSSFKESNKRIYRKLIRNILLLFFSIPSFLLVVFIYSLSNEITLEIFTQLIIMTLILSISMLSKMTFLKRREMHYNYDSSSYAIKKSFFSTSSFIIPSIIISEVILLEAALSVPGLGRERHISNRSYTFYIYYNYRLYKLSKLTFKIIFSNKKH